MEAGTADFSLIMVDINFLKRMNDTHGHERGNDYLKNGSDLICRTFGQETAYRIGGDEFAVVLEGDAQRDVHRRIDEFKRAVGDFEKAEGLEPWQRVSAAVGMTTYEAGRDRCAEDVLRRADEAMYANKIAMKAQRTD